MSSLPNWQDINLLQITTKKNKKIKNKTSGKFYLMNKAYKNHIINEIKCGKLNNILFNTRNHPLYKSTPNTHGL